MTGGVTLTVERDENVPEALWLDNGILRMGFLPAAGGRLLSVRLHGQETLWRDESLLDDRLRPRPGHLVAPHDGDMDAWINYGGDKTWPAPQGWSGPREWAGPPDPVLDSGPYAWETETHQDGAVTVVMRSRPDPRTGLRLERRFTLRPRQSAYQVSLSAENASTTPVRWALWNVTQRRAGTPGDGGVWIGVAADRDPEPVELVTGTAAPAYRAVRADVVHLAHQDVVGKLGFPTAAGWLAHVASGTASTQVFPVDGEASYPDGGSRAEVWMEYPLDEPLEHLGGLRPRHRIVEIEVLGPLTELEPGKRASLEFRCGAAAGTSPVREVAEAGHWGPARHLPGGRLTVDFYAYVSGLLVPGPAAAPLTRVTAGQVIHLELDVSRAGTPLMVVPDEPAGTASAETYAAGTVPRPEPGEGQP